MLYTKSLIFKLLFMKKDKLDSTSKSLYNLHKAGNDFLLLTI